MRAATADTTNAATTTTAAMVDAAVAGTGTGAPVPPEIRNKGNDWNIENEGGYVIGISTYLMNTRVTTESGADVPSASLCRAFAKKFACRCAPRWHDAACHVACCILVQGYPS